MPSTYQAKAEASRAAADTIRSDGDSAITATVGSPNGAIVKAEHDCDLALTALENEVRTTVGL